MIKSIITSVSAPCDAIVNSLPTFLGSCCSPIRPHHAYDRIPAVPESMRFATLLEYRGNEVAHSTVVEYLF